MVPNRASLHSNISRLVYVCKMVGDENQTKKTSVTVDTTHEQSLLLDRNISGSYSPMVNRAGVVP